jgi:hypothetical protein
VLRRDEGFRDAVEDGAGAAGGASASAMMPGMRVDVKG